MKTFVISSLIALAFSTNAYSQQNSQTDFKHEPEWSVTEVKDRNHNLTVGYILQTYSIGTIYSTPEKKVATSLRFICSAFDKKQIISVFWNNNINRLNNQPVEVYIDNRKYENNSWFQDSKIIWQELDSNMDYIKDMQKGKYISIAWSDENNIQHKSIFQLSNFKTKLLEFNKDCQ